MKTIIRCPANRAYRLELDPAEIVPNDPGAGAPEMVFGPGETSATFTCASETGRISSQTHDYDIPQNVMDWLHGDAVDAAIARFWEGR